MEDFYNAPDHFIPEIRFDMSTADIFIKNRDLDVSKTAGSILLATTYSF